MSPFTPEEDHVLQLNHVKGPTYCAKLLGRPKKSVISRLLVLGLRTRGHGNTKPHYEPTPLEIEEAAKKIRAENLAACDCYEPPDEEWDE